MIAHSVISVAGNVGVPRLRNCAATLEQALKSEEGDVEEALGQFASCLTSTSESMQEYLRQSETPRVETAMKSDGEMEGLRSLLLELAEFASARKPKPCQETLRRAETHRWPAELEKDLETLRRLVMRYRFDEVVEMITDMFVKMDERRESHA